MIQIPGRRKDSTIFVHNDFSYNADTRCQDRFRCSLRRVNACRGTLLKLRKQETLEYVLSVEHNHEPNPELLVLHSLKCEMLEMCHDSSTTPRAIYDTVCRRHNTIPDSLTFCSVRSILTRAIRTNKPVVPATITALDHFLQHYGPLQEIYKGCITTENDTLLLLFSTTALLEALETASQIFINCQNWILATDPPMNYLMSVHIEDQYTGIATVLVLCETSSETVHRAVWRKILQLAPGMRNCLKTVIADYEDAAIAVIRDIFPTVKIYGNWLSFKKALWMKWSSLELSTAPRDLLAMAMWMPMAPCSFFDDLLMIMQLRADTMARDQPAVLQFMVYMRTVWLPIAIKLSVYGCPARVSNTVESFQRTAIIKITANTNLLDFFGQWKKLIMHQTAAIDRLRVNGRVTNGHTRTNRERIAKIIRLQQDLVKKRLSVKDFLNAFNLFYVGYEQNAITVPPEEIYLPPEDDYGYWIPDSPELGKNIPYKKVSTVELSTTEISIRKSGTCCICIDKSADQLFQPCNHLCCCKDCVSILEDSACPLCKCEVSSRITVIKT